MFLVVLVLLGPCDPCAPAGFNNTVLALMFCGGKIRVPYKKMYSSFVVSAYTKGRLQILATYGCTIRNHNLMYTVDEAKERSSPVWLHPQSYLPLISLENGYPTYSNPLKERKARNSNVQSTNYQKETQFSTSSMSSKIYVLF